MVGRHWRQSPLARELGERSWELEGADALNFATSRLVQAGVVLPGLALQPGEELFLRWSDVNDNGLHDGLALDDFSLTWSPSSGR